MAINLMDSLSVPFHMQQAMFYQPEYRHYQESDAWSAMLNSSRAPKLPDDVQVELENKQLWQQFHAESTEMIITKTGRRMFPSVQLKVTGLDRRARYCVLMELAQASPRRHKYVGGGVDAANAGGDSRLQGPRGWTSAGPAEPQPPLERRLYVHPDSPSTGAHWMQHPLSFSKLKLTNNVVDNHNNMLLTSMHKYNPRIWIVRCDELANLQNFYENPSKSFVFKETEFVAVTAYQNENITKLKIDNNPFAKGFRESGQSSCKRKRRLQPDDPSNSSEGEEEGNVSSSDSDSATASTRREKRARLSETDAESSCSASSSERDLATPPRPAVGMESARPRLHRPWCDEEEEDKHVDSTTTMQQQCTQRHDLFSAHYHFVALEQFARIQQLQQQLHHRYAFAAAQLDFRR